MSFYRACLGSQLAVVQLDEHGERHVRPAPTLDRNCLMNCVPKAMDMKAGRTLMSAQHSPTCATMDDAGIPLVPSPADVTRDMLWMRMG